jgi:hypothetical protein
MTQAAIAARWRARYSASIGGARREHDEARKQSASRPALEEKST